VPIKGVWKSRKDEIMARGQKKKPSADDVHAQPQPGEQPPVQGVPEGEVPRLEINTSRQFTSWLAEMKASLVFTTYQTGKIFFIGLQPEGKLSIFERTFNRCMGLYGDDQTLWMSSLYQLWRFENMLPEGQAYAGYDRVFVPQMAYTTGDIDAHDIVLDHEKKPIFVNTLFSCLSTFSDTHSFKCVWKPKFITKLAAEDRCHLNGVVMEEGKPKYVTAVSTTDVHEGWREHRKDGGVIIDVDSDEIVASGFSMPHSPRLYQGKFWLLDSGTGYFGHVDLKTGKFERVAFCPGYARGLSFIGDFAVIGLSKIRDNKTFQDLPLSDALEKAKVEARCGLQIVDLRTGDSVHTLNMEGVVTELYDALVLPGVIRPMAIGLKTDEIRRMISIEE
jgi:uncharacterized protein (TIGR03032 family)